MESILNMDWAVIFYTVFLVDAGVAVIVAWLGPTKWTEFASSVSKHFPKGAKGLSATYFALVLLLGYLLGVL